MIAIKNKFILTYNKFKLKVRFVYDSKHDYVAYF